MSTRFYLCAIVSVLGFMSLSSVAACEVADTTDSHALKSAVATWKEVPHQQGNGVVTLKLDSSSFDLQSSTVRLQIRAKVPADQIGILWLPGHLPQAMCILRFANGSSGVINFGVSGGTDAGDGTLLVPVEPFAQHQVFQVSSVQCLNLYDALSDDDAKLLAQQSQARIKASRGTTVEDLTAISGREVDAFRVAYMLLQPIGKLPPQEEFPAAPRLMTTSDKVDEFANSRTLTFGVDASSVPHHSVNWSVQCQIKAGSASDFATITYEAARKILRVERRNPVASSTNSLTGTTIAVSLPLNVAGSGAVESTCLWSNLGPSPRSTPTAMGVGGGVSGGAPGGLALVGTYRFNYLPAGDNAVAKAVFDDLLWRKLSKEWQQKALERLDVCMPFEWQTSEVLSGGGCAKSRCGTEEVKFYVDRFGKAAIDLYINGNCTQVAEEGFARVELLCTR